MSRDVENIHFKFIELLAYWQGTVNTTDLINHFKISRQQAQKYLSYYKQCYPGNIDYSQSSKALVPTTNFRLFCIGDDVTPYLDWLSQNALVLSNDSHRISPKALTNTSLHLPNRLVCPDTMRGLVAAIKQQRRIEVNYISLTNPDGEGRIIQPHIFVKTGLRWHLRAFDEKHKQFRDFVLSRFHGSPDLLDKATHTAEQDADWNTFISLILTPDPRLSSKQQTVIEHDYQMQQGQLEINTRAVLVQYLLQELHLNTTTVKADPCAQQIVISNPNDIKPWLFSA